MASRILFLLVAAAQALPHPQEPSGHSHGTPQADSSLPAGAQALTPEMLKMMPSSKAVKVEQLKPAIPIPGSKKIKLRYGPYKLNAAGSKDNFGNSPSMDPAGTAFNFKVEGVPTDISVLIANSKLVLEDGTPADITKGIYNHHVSLADPAHTKPLLYTCGPGTKVDPLALSGTQSFAGGAEEAGASTFTTLDGKFKSGFYIPKDRVVLLSGDIVNYNNVSKSIFIDTEVEYVDGKPAGFLDASLQMLNLAQCEKDGSAFIKPPEGQKKFTLKGNEITADLTGYLVYSKGHLHDGGKNLIIRINGKQVCNSQASYGGEGKSTTTADGKKWDTLSSMTDCPAPIRIQKGDRISLEASYDLEAHPPREQHGGGMGEEMATLLAFFAEG